MDARQLGQLGRIIRERRGALNMSQPDLAEQAGVTTAFLYMLEAGGLPLPERAALRRVSLALGLARLAALLEDAGTLAATVGVPASVADLATADAIEQFLRELRA